MNQSRLSKQTYFSRIIADDEKLIIFLRKIVVIIIRLQPLKLLNSFLKDHPGTLSPLGF